MNRRSRRMALAAGVTALAVSTTLLAAARRSAQTPDLPNPAAQRQEMIRILGSIERQLGALNTQVDRALQRLPDPKER